MHILHVNDTPAGTILRNELLQLGLHIQERRATALLDAHELENRCILLRLSDPAETEQLIRAIRFCAGDAALIIVLAPTASVFANALYLYQAGADVVLSPAIDAHGIHRTLEHFMFLATFQGQDAHGRRALRNEPQLVAPLLGTVREHLAAAAVLFDAFRMQITLQNGAVYELRCTGDVVLGLERLDSNESVCADDILDCRSGCYLIFDVTTGHTSDATEVDRFRPSLQLA